MIIWNTSGRGDSPTFRSSDGRQAALVLPLESKLVEATTLLMLKSDKLPYARNYGAPLVRSLRVGRWAVPLLAAVLTLASSAIGQDFTLQMDPFPAPAAIDPGGLIATNITVTPATGFSGTVLLTCQVTTQVTGAISPTCAVSPSSVTVSGGTIEGTTPGATVTVSSTGLATPGLYTVAATGTVSGTTTSESAPPQNLTVLAVTPQFTITVMQPVAPSSVHAGSGGTGTISVNPLSGYTIPKGGITLSCSSITPLVTAPPVCSFDPNPLLAGVAFSTLTINTTGPTIPSAAAQAPPRYEPWLPLPILALAGVAAASGKGSRRALCLLAFFVAGGTLLLMPACGAPSVVTTTPSNLITPKNAYTFTLMGVDSNGVTSSNTGANSSAPTVTLTVD